MADYDRAKKLYMASFPATERLPFFLMKRRSRQGRADFWDLSDGDLWLGMAFVAAYADMAYINYFAIDKALRGKRYGTRAMALLLEQYRGKRVFLLLEDWTAKAPDQAQRIRRHAFYERCGLMDLPYRVKDFDVLFSVMGTGGIVSHEEYKRLNDHLLGWPFKYFFRSKLVV